MFEEKYLGDQVHVCAPDDNVPQEWAKRSHVELVKKN